MSNVVQYIVVRGDLIRAQSWPLGAVIAQACHAATAVVHLFHDHQDTQAYLQNLDNMHKVVLEAKDELHLKRLEEKLKEANIDHKVWVEQPENFPTCLAVRPYPKEQVQGYFKGLNLYRK